METNKLFVGNLSWNLDWKALKDIFKEFWEVAYVRVVTDKETWRSRGFGFVEFQNVEDAVRARDSLNGKDIDGRQLKIDFAQEKRESSQERREA